MFKLLLFKLHVNVFICAHFAYSTSDPIV